MNKSLFTLLLLILLTAMLYAQSDAVENTYLPDAIALFDKLYAGDVSVADQIDWNNLYLFYSNYGEDYAKLTDEQQKQNFRENFIRGFVDKCTDKGLSPADLSGWSLGDTVEDRFVVYADWYPDWVYMIFTKVGSKALLREIYVEYDEYGDY